jgi:hypothetical protein
VVALEVRRMKHHPSCPDEGAHVHAAPAPLCAVSFVVWFDGAPVAATGERLVADRLAELVNAHGLADVPDCIPDDVLWGPPGPEERIVDFRLPENPSRSERP